MTQKERVSKHSVKNMDKTKSYKINLHILENCNCTCRHCFAHFNNTKLIQVSDWKRIVDNCISTLNVTEFNIAGGEPLLYKDLIELVVYIRNKGIKVSIITNGILMTETWINNYAHLWSTIGFSVDSFDAKNSKALGRTDRCGKVFTKEDLNRNCKLIKKYNPECKIKMNTVVTSINHQEVLSGMPKEIDRWKIIKMKYYEDENFSNRDLLISDQEFDEFVDANLEEVAEAEALNAYTKSKESNESFVCNKEKNGKIVIEKQVSGSYLIIDANGYLLDNHEDNVYRPICNCLEENLSEGLNKLIFDETLYRSRY